MNGLDTEPAVPPRWVKIALLGIGITALGVMIYSMILIAGNEPTYTCVLP